MKTRQPTCSRQSASIGSLILLTTFVAATAPTRADIIYVSNWNNDTIEKFDSVTGRDLGIFAQPEHPRGIALDRAGNLYVVAYGSQSIMRYTPGGVGSIFAGGVPGPESIAFDSAGNLYVGSIWNNNIMRFTPNGVGSIFATNANQPYSLAFDTAGNLYSANFSGNVIDRFTPEGIRSVFATGLNHPYGLAFDDEGNLYAASYHGGRIQKITPSGVGSVFAIGGLTDPAGLAFDGAGNLYVADQWASPYSIIRFTPDGVRSVFANSDMSNLSGPVSIAIHVVPEPSLMTLLGVGLPALLAFRIRTLRSRQMDLERQCSEPGESVAVAIPASSWAGSLRR